MSITDFYQFRNTTTRCRSARVVRFFVVLALAALLLPQAADAKRARFEQMDFVVALWGDPPVDEAVNARYVTIREAGFTVVLGGVGADEPDKARLQRDAADAAKVKVIFSTYGLPVKMLCNCDATYGFLVRDHPTKDEFKKVRKRMEEIRLGRPDKVPFVNLLPPSAAGVELGAESYAAYLDKCMDIMKPEILCYDYFPDFAPGQDTRAIFIDNLATMRQAALQYDRPFWNFIKAMPYDSDASPTDAQLRWQAWTSMAHGSRGLIYFAYWPPPGDMHVRGDGILTKAGDPTPRYDFVKAFNVGLRSVGTALFAMESVAVASGTQPAAGGVVDSISAAGGQSLDVMTGAFQGESGSATLLVNNALEAETVVTLAFTGKVQELDKATGQPMAVEDSDADTPGIQLRLEAGDARLFLSAD